LLKGFHLEERPAREFYRGKGCKACRSTGYRGRTGIYELLIIDEELRKLILADASTTAIRETARRSQQMRSLREDGLAKALRGFTTLEEVDRITFED